MSQPFFVYMLRCADGSYYTGHTDDLELRLAKHRSGELGGYTFSRRPVELVFASEMPTRDEAIMREWQIKGWSRAKKLALIASDWNAMRVLARGRARGPLPGQDGEVGHGLHPSTGSG